MCWKSADDFLAVASLLDIGLNEYQFESSKISQIIEIQKVIDSIEKFKLKQK